MRRFQKLIEPRPHKIEIAFYDLKRVLKKSDDRLNLFFQSTGKLPREYFCRVNSSCFGNRMECLGLNTRRSMNADRPSFLPRNALTTDRFKISHNCFTGGQTSVAMNFEAFYRSSHNQQLLPPLPAPTTVGKRTVYTISQRRVATGHEESFRCINC